ncbi:hypothetical protein F5Y08DRAFT_257370 [Xylaria arbuscula]|nr:hypothetical protein F5Y08DRAFT_257370 [Xylaria arbuscula]
MTATLWGLPMELKHKIMITIDSLEDILNTAITCKAMYRALKAGEGIITHTVLSQILDPGRLAIAVAHHAAVKAPWKYDIRQSLLPPNNQAPYLEHVTGFCELYLSKQATELLVPITDLTLPMALYIEDFDAAAQELSVWASDTLLPRGVPDYEHDVFETNTAEFGMIAKAFYILDMVLHLFPLSPVTQEEHQGPNPAYHDQSFNKFWSYFAPWESAQVQFLSREVLLHIMRARIEEGWKIGSVSSSYCDYQWVLISIGVKGFHKVINSLALSAEYKRPAHYYHLFPYIRRQYYQDRYRWYSVGDDYAPNFPCPFYYVVFRLKNLQQYNLEESGSVALMWISDCLSLSHPEHDLEEVLDPAYKVIDYASGFRAQINWLFWSTDRVGWLNRGPLPSLDDLRQFDGAVMEMHPDIDKESFD